MNLNQRELQRVIDDVVRCKVLIIAWCKGAWVVRNRETVRALWDEMMESADQKRNDGLRWRYHDYNCRHETSFRER